MQGWSATVQCESVPKWIQISCRLWSEALLASSFNSLWYTLIDTRNLWHQSMLSFMHHHPLKTLSDKVSKLWSEKRTCQSHGNNIWRITSFRSNCLHWIKICMVLCHIHLIYGTYLWYMAYINATQNTLCCTQCPCSCACALFFGELCYASAWFQGFFQIRGC